MKFSKILTLLALGAIACGGAPEAPETQTDSDPGYVDIGQAIDHTIELEVDGGPLAEYGTARQALVSAPFLFGKRRAQFGAGVCGFPNTSQDYCIIPADKKIRPVWASGTPTTSSLFPGVDFPTVLKAAVAKIKSETNWDVAYGNSSSNEFMQLSNSFPNDLGDTIFTVPLSANIHQVGPVGDEYYGTFNTCDIRINPTKMANAWAGYSANAKLVKIQRLMEHELGHCMGFADFYFSGASFYLMNGFDADAPVHFTADEISAVSGFHL